MFVQYLPKRLGAVANGGVRTVLGVAVLSVTALGTGVFAPIAHATLRVAAIGDFGETGEDELAVANLVHSLNPDIIITMGDNSYSDFNIDDNVGQYYSDYIGSYVGVYGPGSLTGNRFFPSLGNHDYSDGGGLEAYLDYFTLPGLDVPSSNTSANERYYDFVYGPVHFFAINSCGGEPDDNESDSIQAEWLQQQLAASTSPWKIVYFHHAAYSSGRKHGNNAYMQWPFKAWGASAVLQGHDHVYERLIVDGLPYFVNGLGGRSTREFSSNPEPGSMARYRDDFGAMLLTADDTSLRFEFFSINPADSLVDSYTITQMAPDIDVAPMAIDYGTAYVTTVHNQEFDVNNVGTARLDVATLMVEGPDAGDFIVVGAHEPASTRYGQVGVASATLRVDPGAAERVSVRFAPSSPGPKQAVLRVISNDPNEPNVAVTLQAAAVPQPAPEIQVAPDTLDFGEVQMPTSKTRTVWVWNDGDAALEIASVTLDGPHVSEFTLLAGSGAHVLAPGDSLQLLVRCEPATEGIKDAHVRIASNDEDEGLFLVSLQADAIPPQPDIDVVPTVVDFDSTMATVPASRRLWIYSAGLVELDIVSTQLLGPDAAAFMISSGGEPTTLAVGDSTSIVLTFIPSTEGAKTATLRIESNDPTENPTDVPLLGFALPPPTPDIGVSADTLDLGSVAVTTSPTSQTLGVFNHGTGDLSLDDVFVLGPDAVDFIVTNPTPLVVSPADSTEIFVTFDPATEGPKSATLRIVSDDPDQPATDVFLYGTGLPPPAPDIDSTPQTDYGGVSIAGGSATQVIEVHNRGSATLDIGGVSLVGTDAADFAVTSGPSSTTLVPGDSTEIHVAFTPTVPGSKSAALRITSNDPDENPYDISLGGVGVDPTGTPSSIVLQESVTGSSSGGTDVTTSNSVSAVAGDLYLAAVASKTNRTVTSVSGLGLSWAPVIEQCSGRDQTGVHIWMGSGSPVPGDVTATLSDDTDSAVLIVSRYSGVSPETPVGSVVSGNTNGVAGACSDGFDSNAYDLPLNTSAPGAVVFGAVAARNRTAEPGADYTLRAESRTGSGGKATSIATMDRTVPQAGAVTFDGSLSATVDWAAAALELRPTVFFAEITVTPASYDFGAMDVGQSATTSIQIRNDGAADLQLPSIAIHGEDLDDFAIDSGGGSTLLPAGATHTVTVRFTPQVAGARNALLRIVSNDADETTTDVTLIGTGIAVQSDIIVEPLTLDFGGVQLGSSASLLLRVTNVGNGPLDVTSNAFSGAHSSDFSVVSGAAPFLVAPGDSALLEVGFSPLAEAARGATLHLTTNDPDAAVVDVPVGGSGMPVPESDVDVTPASHDFGAVTVSQSAAFTFRVRNLGGATLNVLETVVTGADSLVFTVSAGGAPFTVAAGDSADVSVVYAPTSLGTHNAVLRVTSDDADEGTIDLPLTGNATPQPQPDIAVVPASHDFGDIPTASSMTFAFEVLNAGDDSLDVFTTTIVGADSLEFAVSNGAAPFAVVAGDTAEISVTFTPATDGAKSAALRIESNDPDEASLDIALVGNGVPPTPGMVAFEESAHGDASSDISVETENSLAAVEGHLYLAAVATKGYRAVTGVSGMGLTWTLVRAQCGAREQTGVEVWMGNGTPSAGTVTATLESEPSKAVIVVSRYSGADPSAALGAIVASNTDGENGDCSGGNDNDSFDFSLQTTSHAGFVYTAVAMRHRNLTPGNGYTLRDETRVGSAGTVASVAVLDQEFAVPTTATVDGTFDGDVDWAVIALEIVPATPTTKQAPATLPVREPALSLRNGVGGIDPWIELASPQPTRANVRIYDVRGRLVDAVWNGPTPAGRARLAWSGVDRFGRALPAGIYLVRAEIGARVFTGKLILLR